MAYYYRLLFCRTLNALCHTDLLCAGAHRKLKQSAVPNVFQFTTSGPKKPTRQRSQCRRGQGQCVAKAVPVSSSEYFTSGCQMSTDIGVIGHEECISTSYSVCEDFAAVVADADGASSSIVKHSHVVQRGVQCTLLTEHAHFSVRRFIDDPVGMKYYTGFDDYEHFVFFLSVLGPVAYHLKYRCSALATEDHLFITLMKLRQSKDDVELSLLFQISPKTVYKVISVWVNFMYYQLNELNLWPTRKAVNQHMPKGFGRLFPTTRVILDATECPIEKSANVALQSTTFSSYKNCNTVKTMIGCTPRGAVCFVSDSYGGSTSDRQMIERSPLCTNASMFASGDSIMADRGIMVQDLFAVKDVKVNTPHMLRGKSQLEPHEVIHDRRVASKRIHIERVIGLAKTFKILRNKMSLRKLRDAGKIVFVCFVINNFRNCIVGPFA